MATINTHLVIGERVFEQCKQLAPATYGTFLLGCALVDVNSFTEISRRVTHFVGRPDEDGDIAYTRSCDRFLERLDDLLLRPPSPPTPEEYAFIAGYLCHLAADEVWKALSVRVSTTLQQRSWDDYPGFGNVILTVYSTLAHAHYRDFPAVAAALRTATVPDVFTHVPHSDLVAMWRAIRPSMLEPYTAESFYAMLRRSGSSEADLCAVRRKHEQHWDTAHALIDQLSSVPAYLAESTEHAVRQLRRLEPILEKRLIHVH